MKYVALLRGINVGGNKKVEMAQLKKVFESLGCTKVFTYINSGNVIFETNENIEVFALEEALYTTFGFKINLVLRDAKNIKKLCKEIPDTWKNDTQQKTDVLFLWDKFDTKKSLDLITSTDIDAIQYIAGAIVWNVHRDNYAKSGMKKFTGTQVYKNMTARNINTVRKLAELLE
jgi:uncharacterized protein (DUF1697 family)